MGCSQSKATDQVVERVSVDTPAVEAPAPESIKTTESEVAVEAPPATADELPPAPASVPVEAVEEAPKTEEPAAPVEDVVEEPAVEEPVAEKPDAVEEPAEKAAPVDEESAAPVEEEAAPVEEAPKTEEKSPEVEEETPVEAEAPKSEPAVEEAPQSEPVVEEPVVEEPVVEEQEETSAEEPNSEATPAPVSEAKPTQDALKFTAEDVTFNDKGVAFYNYDGSDGVNPANDVHVSKRYSEFKALHAQLTSLLSDNQADLPALPKASMFQGRKNKKMLEDRKTQFNALLNAVASHPVAAQSDVFKAFLA